MIVPEPTIIPADEKNQEFWNNDQLETLFRALANLQLTSRDGAIQHNDKAGNLAAIWIVFTSNVTANTIETITHGLGRVPLGLLASIPDRAAILYDGGAVWTTTTVSLKSSVGSTNWKAILF
jgi:hypothetical protein